MRAFMVSTMTRLRPAMHIKPCLLVIALFVNLRVTSSCPTNCQCTPATQVNCEGAGLTSFPDNLPAGMTHLNMARNNVTSLEPQALASYTSLEVLNLTANRINTVAMQALEGLTNLLQLDLSGNNIEHLIPRSFRDLQAVNIINLSRNPFRTFPTGVFHDCRRLTKLEMEEAALDSTAFPEMSKLVQVDHLAISGNNFSHLPYLMLEKMTNLKTLAMARSGVGFIDNSAFVGLRSLQKLDLAGNPFRQIAREMFQPLEALAFLTLSDGRLTCDCGTWRVRDWMESRGVTLLGSATCRGPDGKSHDLATADLSGFCSGVVPPTNHPPTQPCASEASLELQLVSASHDTAEIQWRASNVPTDAMLTSVLRIYDKVGTESTNTIAARLERRTFSRLSAGSDYVLCFLQVDCRLYQCVDFTTQRDPKVGGLTEPSCVPTETAAGIAVAAAAVVLVVGLLTLFLVLKGVCCCPPRQKQFSPPPPSPGPARQTQPVMPMQMSQSYTPSTVQFPSATKHNNNGGGGLMGRSVSVRSSSNTYDDIPLQSPDRVIFHNPSYKHRERPRQVNDPLPPIQAVMADGRKSNSPGVPTHQRGSSNEIIQGISSCYLHPSVEPEEGEKPPLNKSANPGGTAGGAGRGTTAGQETPGTYLHPVSTTLDRPKGPGPAKPSRHSLPTSHTESPSEPYHLYQEANDVAEDVVNKPPQYPSPATLKRQFQNKPSLSDFPRELDSGTGRVIRFKKPKNTPKNNEKGELRSISTPDLLAGDEIALTRGEVGVDLSP